MDYLSELMSQLPVKPDLETARMQVSSALETLEEWRKSGGKDESFGEFGDCSLERVADFLKAARRSLAGNS